ncbi:MAG: hypothetical protein K0S41_2750 [Anaerocolumna sp.]|jgi:hypothetical protein|nr:hypothetical protein [Anaerocolumna sp.]
MKTCPNCHELVGDNANTCFQCGYTFGENGSIQYICMDCGKPLPFAYSNCQCGGRATSRHTTEVSNTGSTKKDSRLYWLFNKKHLKLKLAILILLMILIPLYFIIFLTKGVYYENSFMKIEKTGDTILFSGKHYNKDIMVEVKNGLDTKSIKYVDFHLPNNINRSYIVNYNKIDWKNGLIIKTSGGETIFDGTYLSGYLFEKDNTPFLDYTIRADVKKPFDDTYQISPYNVITFAFDDFIRFRGNVTLLIIAFILLLITFIDYMFPMFFFRLEHFIDVRNPEPSDFYLFFQRLTWILVPIISVILLIIALFGDFVFR